MVASRSVSADVDLIHRSNEPAPATTVGAVNGSVTKPSPVPSGIARQSYCTSAFQMSLPLPV